MCMVFHIYVAFNHHPHHCHPNSIVFHHHRHHYCHNSTVFHHHHHNSIVFPPPLPPIVLSPYQKPYKARHKKISAIRVWESVAYTSFLSEQIRKFLNMMKKLYIPNHKLYEEYYLYLAKQKGGNLLAFHGSWYQQGYGLGSIIKGLFR